MIQLTDLTLRHGATTLLANASATIHRGQKIGLIGANGSGKTSLFRLLLGELTADGGEVLVPADWTVAHLAQEIGHLDRLAIDHVLDGDRRLRKAEQQLTNAEALDHGERIALAHAALADAQAYSARARAARMLDGLGFLDDDRERPIKDFSGGWRIRLNLARTLMAAADLLLLDEPTNHLDLEAMVWLESWLQRYPGTLIVISHDRDFLDQVVDSVVHIDQLRLSTYRGGYSAFERQRAERLTQQQATHAQQQRQIAQLRSFIDRFRAKASKARAAQSRLKVLQRMEQVAPAYVDSPFCFRFPDPPAAADPLVHLDRVALAYDASPILESVSLSLAPGDRIGLLGPNGAGKSTLIKALAGELQPVAGRLTRARGLRVGYFAQHQLERLDGRASPLSHLRRIDGKADEQRLRDFLGGFDFGAELANAPVESRSGGEKARLVLALLVWQAPNLLLLDEPTNHLDLDMRHALTLALHGFDGAVLLVSHDRHLLKQIADRHWLAEGGTVHPYSGGLEAYRQGLKETSRRREAQQSLAAGKPAQVTRAGDHQTHQQLRALRKQAERLARKVDQSHAALVEVDQEMARLAMDPKHDRRRMQALQTERERQVTEQTKLEQQWLAVEQQIEHTETGQGN